MKFGEITLGDLFGGYEIVNESADKLPQNLASAFGIVNAGLLGATYVPIWYVGHQLVNGTNYQLICREVRVSKTADQMIVAMTINIPAGEGFERGEGAKVVSIVEGLRLPDELKTIVEKAEKQLIGVSYTPVAYIGHQLVRGVNHYFICQAKPIYPGAIPYAVMMCVNLFENEVTVVSIEKL